MATGILPSFGRPGIGSAQVAQRRNVSRNGAFDFHPGGGTIKGSVARDPGNSAYSTLCLRPGLVMGKITSSGYWANSILGVTGGALTSIGTSVTIPAATSTELARRVGATGTFKLTGPPTASGTVRTLTATYSALGATTATITALGVNEVQTVNLVTAATAGSIRLYVQKPDGTLVLTPAAAWSATDATLLSNLQTALDTATGVTNGIVASAIAATDTDLGFVLTFSGTGYANLSGPTSGGSWALVGVQTLFTSNTGSYTVRTTAGVDGRFVTGSLIQPTDGSETPLSLIPDGYGLVVPDDSSDIDFPMIPVAGILDTTNIIDYPADSSTKAWLRGQLSNASGGKFVFSDQY